MGMSEELDTIREGVTIGSIATRESYNLTVYEPGKGAIRSDSFPNADYEVLMKGLWEKYLGQGEKPELVGETLTDQGFVWETLHIIAPGVFFGPGGPPLTKNQESFVYWLKGKMPDIEETLEPEQARYLSTNLDQVLHTHLERTK